MIKVGDRVRSIKEPTQVGTVRFSGIISQTKSSKPFYGVEWDLPVGKYDGEFKGTRYFTCAPLHGSFVKSHKLERGISLSEAIKIKYFMNLHKGAMSAGVSLSGTISVQLIGQEKIAERQRRNLTEIGLNSMPVSHLNSTEDLDNIRELDLSDTMVSTLQDGLTLISRYPRLRHLDLSGCPLYDYTPDITCERALELVLNRTQLTDAHLSGILSGLPSLASLHIDSTGVTLASAPPEHRLQELSLCNCTLEGWGQLINTLSVLPSLDTLVASGCGLPDFPICLSPGDQSHWPQIGLKQLIAKGLPLTEEGAYRLSACLHRLEHLAIGTKSLDRDTAISVFPHLVRLNGTTVGAAERKEAERAFLWRLVSSVPTDPEQVTQFIDKHKVFLPFLRKHDPSLPRRVRRALAAHLGEEEEECGEEEEQGAWVGVRYHGEDGTRLKLEVPRSTQLWRLKLLLLRRLGLKPDTPLRVEACGDPLDALNRFMCVGDLVSGPDELALTEK